MQRFTKPGVSNAKRRILVWFRNDLRTHDCAPLYEAARLAQRYNGGVEVLPVYCFDPRQYGLTTEVFYQSGFGALKTGYFRAKFILESVIVLKQQLQKLGSDLLICIGQPEDILPSLLDRDLRSTKPLVLASAEVAPEEKIVERAVKNAIKSHGGMLNLYWTNSLCEHEEVLNQFGGQNLTRFPTTFTKFKNKVERNCSIIPPLPSPTKQSLPLPTNMNSSDLAFIPTLDDIPWTTPPEVPAEPVADTVFPWRGGEISGLARVEEYLFDTDAIATYFDTRNGMMDTDYSTKFSPWLACGALSARYIQSRVEAYQNSRVSNKSTYWVTFELTWRDFFWYLTLAYGREIFQLHGLTQYNNKNKHFQWSQDSEVFNQWKTGTLGVPFVDANMRELLQTGWMSNRGRQNVASYLIHELGIDWRMGAEHFEEYLLDYDPASNWGNWVAAAGLTGGRVNRFNIPRQAKVYDPEGEYVHKWLPELGKSSTSSRVNSIHKNVTKSKKFKKKKKVWKRKNKMRTRGVEHYMSMVV